MLSNLLIYRFVILNALAFAGMGVLHRYGVILPLFEQDTSYISHGIVVVFLLGWFWTFKEIITVSKAVNADKASGPEPALESHRDKDVGKTEWLAKIPEWLVTLGLIGTVLGFYQALSAMDIGAIGNVKAAQSSISTFMQGMRVAIITTIVGAVTGLWTEINIRILKTALSSLWSDRISAAFEEHS